MQAGEGGEAEVQVGAQEAEAEAGREIVDPIPHVVEAQETEAREVGNLGDGDQW